jgi:hypothetical protein
MKSKTPEKFEKLLPNDYWLLVPWRFYATVAEIFRGQEGHGMLVVYCKCITVSPKGYLVRQRFWQF